MAKSISKPLNIEDAINTIEALNAYIERLEKVSKEILDDADEKRIHPALKIGFADNITWISLNKLKRVLNGELR